MRQRLALAHASLFLEDARPLLLDSCRLFGPQGSHERDIVQTLIRAELSILQRATDQDLCWRFAVLKEWF